MFTASDFTYDNRFAPDAYIIRNFDTTFVVISYFGFAGTAVIAAYCRLAVNVDFFRTFGQIFLFG